MGPRWAWLRCIAGNPTHTGEAPPPIAAFLAGGMTLAAFLGILRFFQLCVASGQGPFAGGWMTVFGLLSIATAAVFIVGNRDYRRLLAYTSVEHMGVLVLGMGLGVFSSYGAYFSLLHAMHNTLNKGVLFFAAGMIWRIYGTNRIERVRGTIHRNRLAAAPVAAGTVRHLGNPAVRDVLQRVGHSDRRGVKFIVVGGGTVRLDAGGGVRGSLDGPLAYGLRRAVPRFSHRTRTPGNAGGSG